MQNHITNCKCTFSIPVLVSTPNTPPPRKEGSWLQVGYIGSKPTRKIFPYNSEPILMSDRQLLGLLWHSCKTGSHRQAACQIKIHSTRFACIRECLLQDTATKGTIEKAHPDVQSVDMSDQFTMKGHDRWHYPILVCM